MSLSLMYFDLCKNICQEMKGPKGKSTVGYWENEKKLDIREETKWAPIRVAIPLLFNFYHAVEIFMKGAILCRENSVHLSHDFNKLFEGYKSAYPEENELAYVLGIYINPQQGMICDWMNKNGLSTEDFYKYIRYPTDKKGLKQVKYWPLYLPTGRKGIPPDYKIMEEHATKFIKNIGDLLVPARTQPI